MRTRRGQFTANGEQPASIESLVASFHGDVYRSALFLSGNANDAEDLTQQTFLQAMRKLYQLRDPKAARHWLLAILRNCFLHDKRGTREIPWDRCEEIAEQSLVVNETAKASDLGIGPEELMVAVQALDEHHRVVIAMFYFERKSYQEIASELNVKLGTVMSRLARAKEQLRQQITRRFGSSTP